MLNRIILLLILIEAIPISLAYTTSNSDLNITVYDDYNSYSKSNADLNITTQANVQAYTASNNNLNITFAYLPVLYLAEGTTTTSVTTTTAATTTTSGGGGGGGGGGGRTIIEQPIREVIRETIREIIREGAPGAAETAQGILGGSPYRLSIIILTALFVFLMVIRFADYFKEPRFRTRRQMIRRPRARPRSVNKGLKNLIKKAMNVGYTEKEIKESFKKAMKKKKR